jgi:hypothetical protein
MYRPLRCVISQTPAMWQQLISLQTPQAQSNKNKNKKVFLHGKLNRRLHSKMGRPVKQRFSVVAE